ncbi:hypothetical protein GEMRC1_008698 [Eukaryota sp. GEM-RC1]
MTPTLFPDKRLSSSYGIPSSQCIAHFLQRNQPLSEDLFHFHWRIHHAVEVVPVPDTTPPQAPTLSAFELLTADSLSQEQTDFVNRSLQQLIQEVSTVPAAPRPKKNSWKTPRCKRRNPSAFELPQIKRPRGRPRKLT